MTPTTPEAAIDKLVAETKSLCTLPAVALEVLRLTESDHIDAAALKTAIERDPALVVKLLKVVNSSLFGVAGEVSNLTQALALLGARPLRMLVLGFSLPDQLLAAASADELDHFWRSSLTRALVARDLATQYLATQHLMTEHLATEHLDPSPSGSRGSSAGDDAFVAGLLQDLGVMVLLNQLGEPYAQLLDKARTEGVEPTVLEQESLGFTRRDVGVALLRDWRLPPAIVDAIAGTGDGANDGPLPRALELANLLVRLVVDRQLDALHELIDRGEAYCGLTPQQLRAMVEPLEQRVADLAAAMAAPLADDADYLQVITDAHARLSLVTENALVTQTHLDPKHNPAAALDDDQLCQALLAESHELRLAMRQFLAGRPRDAERLLRAEGAHHPAGTAAGTPAAGTPAVDGPERQRLHEALAKLAPQTRTDRQPLSVALLQVDADLEDRWTDRQLREALADAGGVLAGRRAVRLTLGPQLVALLLPAVGRGDAVAFVQEIERLLADPANAENANPMGPDGRVPHPIAARAGVASIELLPNRFDVAKLIDAASCCLSSAKTGSPTSVRSIEVY